MPMLAELCLPLVKKGGHFIAMKGPDYEEDLVQATRALKMLGAEVEAIIPVQLRDNMGKRTLIKIRKVTSTPAIYPRAFAVIKKKPL
jgi:16S rRNA (guanine527-N7)-methyltransferase